MRHPIVRFFQGVLIVLSAALAHAGPPRIAAFQGDRSAAVSYTFDDNLRDQFTLAVPMLEESGIRATFFVIPGKTAETAADAEAMKPGSWGSISWPELVELSRRGHEIASHTWAHENLTRLDDPARVKDEIEKARDAISDRIGVPPVTLAFPYNASDEAIRKAALREHAATRDFQTGFGKAATADAMNAWLLQNIRDKKWGVAMFHGIASGFDAFENPEALREHFRFASRHGDQVWIDTFANVSRYLKERDAAELKAEEKPGEAIIVLDSPLDPRLFDVPLTIVIDAEGASSATAVRSGERLPARVAGGKILVDAVPSREPIAVNWR